MKPGLAATLTILLFCAFLNKEPEKLRCHRSFTSAQLKADFLFLTSHLRNLHPDLYRVSSERVISKRMGQIQKSIGSTKTYLEFLKLLAPLFTEIGCMNTQWGHSPEYINYRNENIPLFPFQLKIEGSRFFIEDNYSNEASLVPGTEILKINGEAVQDYLEKNYSLLPTDGKIRSVQQRWLEAYFPQHHSNFWQQPDTFKLEVKDNSGKIFAKAVAALLKKQMAAKKNSVNREVSSTRFYISGNTGVLAIPSFKESQLENFVDSCFTVVQNQKIKNLVIDLKGEGAGNLYFGSVLYSYLKQEPSKYAEQIHYKGDSSFNYADPAVTYDAIGKLAEELTNITPPKKNSFNGKLYILTDGWTIHSKGLFCAKVSERPNTFFVGEECGSSIFGINEFPVSITLPNTGIQVLIPTCQIEINSKNHASTVGVKVDYPLKEIQSGKVMAQTLDLIKAREN